MSQHMLIILLVFAISMKCESRPQSNSLDGIEDVEVIQPVSTEKTPTELFFGPTGSFVGEVQVSTGSLTVNKKPRRKPKPSQDGPRASALISDDSFGDFRSLDSLNPVAVAAGPTLSISSGGPVLSFNKPAEVIPAQ